METLKEIAVMVLQSEIAGQLILFVAISAATWVMGRMKWNEMQRQRALDALTAGVDFVWRKYVRPLKLDGVKIDPLMASDMRERATTFAESLLTEGEAPAVVIGEISAPPIEPKNLVKALGSQEAIDGQIEKIISDRKG